jgi:hypothetical protein
MLRALVLSAGLVVTLTPSSMWAMEADEFLKLSPSAQAAYVAGVVDTLAQRHVLAILDKNPNVSLSEVNQTPIIRCLVQSSYGTVRSVTLDLLRQEPPGEQGTAAFVVIRAVARLCPE